MPDGVLTLKQWSDRFRSSTLVDTPATGSIAMPAIDEPTAATQPGHDPDKLAKLANKTAAVATAELNEPCSCMQQNSVTTQQDTSFWRLTFGRPTAAPTAD